MESGKFHPTVNRGVKEKTTKGSYTGTGCAVCSNILTLCICLLFSVLYCMLTIHQALFKLQGAQKGQRKGKSGELGKQDITVDEFIVIRLVQLSSKEFTSIISTSQ